MKKDRSLKFINQDLLKELVYLAIVFVGLIALLKIAFYKESLINVAKLTFSIFWLGLLPGYAMLLYYRNKLGFLERVIIGTALGYAVLGIVSYHLGLAGLHIKYHHLVLPLLEIAVGTTLYYIFKAKLDIVQSRSEN